MNMVTSARPLRITIIAYWHDPRFRRKQGGLIRIFELADNLTKSGHKIQLFLPKLGYPQDQTIASVKQIPFIDLPLIRPLTFHAVCNVALLLHMLGKVDAVYLRQMNSFIPLLIARIFGVTGVYEIPNDPFLAYEQSGAMRRVLEKFMDRCSMRLAERIVVLSQWSKERLNRLGGIPLSKIAVLPSGTDIDLFRPMDNKECLVDLGLDPSLLYIGFTGSFHADQGIDTLIDAAPSIISEIKNVRFLLVGDGPMAGPWRERIERLGLGEVFIFSGQVPYRSVPKYIGAMDICVAPHRASTNQSSPVKLFDYMACQRPIVASDIDVVREIVAESGCAILVDPESPDDLYEEVKILLGEEGKRRSMAEKGRRHVVEKYDRKSIVEDVVTIIIEKRIAGKGPGNRSR